MRIAIFGLGYVGAVSCGCLADLGHTVVGCDINKDKVDLICRGKPPIVEEGLTELLEKALHQRALSGTTDPAEAVQDSDIALVCVGTPSTASGAVNAVHLETVCRQIGEALRRQSPETYTVLSRSTSPPAVHRRLMGILRETTGREFGQGLGYVCHPEFLREGVSVWDFNHPPKIVFGPSDPQAAQPCRGLYPGIEAPTFYLTPEEAAMVKYADNSFHALKCTFANEIGMICRTVGVDGQRVMEVVRADTKLNISTKYLKPGLAFGGSCLPKDLRGILDVARDASVSLPMLAGVLASNELQIRALLDRVISDARPKVGVIGLAFKEGTDDVRESPMVAVVEQLCGKGHPVRVYDAHLSLQALVGANSSFAFAMLPHLADLMVQEIRDVVGWADVLIVSHRLETTTWVALDFGPDQRVIDLVDIPELRKAKGYEGLYW